MASSVEEVAVSGEEPGASLAVVKGGDASSNVYACSAVHGFFRSIALSVENSLQDTLR